MTTRARVGNLGRLSQCGRDEAKRVTSHHHIGDGLRDSRHVARYTFVAAAAGFVMGVCLDGCRVRPVGRGWPMALQAHHGSGLQEVRIIGSAVNIMTTEAGHALRVHDAGRKVIALHPVLVRRAVGEVSERRFAQLMIFQLPIISEFQTGSKTDWPVVILAGDRVLQRTAL